MTRSSTSPAPQANEHACAPDGAPASAERARTEPATATPSPAEPTAAAPAAPAEAALTPLDVQIGMMRTLYAQSVKTKRKRDRDLALAIAERVTPYVHKRLDVPARAAAPTKSAPPPARRRHEDRLKEIGEWK